MNMYRTVMASSLGMALLSGCIHVNASNIDFESTETLTLSGEGIERIKIDASAGFLKVEGDSSGSVIEVIADLAVEQDNYKLSLDKRSNGAVLIAEASTHSWGSWSGNSPKIDLTVRLPKGMDVEIIDGSGFIEIRKIDGKVKIKDGSGNINAANLHGGLTIVDGSGGMELEDIKGDVEIDDGSGSIEINRTSASVDIEDGSGGIALYDIGGKVNVNDGSGHLLIERAKGHVTIDDGSGGIEVRELEDGLTVINAGSGGLTIKEVKGNVST